jgi:hypothetical protein
MIEWRTVLVGFVIAVLVVIAAFASALFGVSTLPSQLTLINRSAATVSEARLRQGDRELAVGAIEPGRIRTTDFISRNGSLTLAVRFSSGHSVSADNIGYLAAGTPVIVVFEVTDNKVALLTITKRRIGRRP